MKNRNIIETVKARNLSYLTETALQNLQEQAIQANKLKGIFIEAGCALGGSSIVIANAKVWYKKLFIYDVFGMIPPPSNEDAEDVHKRYETIKSGQSQGLNGDTYYGYVDDLLNTVKGNFADCGVSLKNVNFVKGLYENTLKISHPVAFAHIDCDWYESVTTCLNQIVPNVVVGGIIVIDDYYDWSGCKKAVDDFFKDKQSSFEMIFGEKLTIIKK
jgi:Macrocin-O-methyltransferase (TylF).